MASIVCQSTAAPAFVRRIPVARPGRAAVCTTAQPSQRWQRAPAASVRHRAGLASRAQAAATAEAVKPAVVGQKVVVPGGKGKAVALKKGQILKITNTYGEQVVDFWAFGLPDLQEVMSMHHTHDTICRLIPQVGDELITNLRRPILTFLEDTGPGVHDTTVAACDNYLYERQLGDKEAAWEHDSCTRNLHNALGELGLKLTDNWTRYLPPAPFNLWMAVSLTNEGSQLSWDPPAEGQKAGDYCTFRAELDCVAVMSACPHDLSPINGPDGPKDVHFEVFDA